MKPLHYLTDNGNRIFKQILNAIPRGISKDIDTYELSMLANAFDLHERASVVMNHEEGGFVQTTKNNYSQIKAEFTVWQKTGDFINKHSSNFGLNPASREKIKIFAKKEVKKETEFDKLVNNY